MPDGLLQWYDDRQGEGRVVRGGRRYSVRAEDMEPHARVPGARVHFDIKRRDGTAVAANVRLREGTRVSRRQRRFGDMVGARRPDTRGTAPFARPHPGLGHTLAAHPETVVRRWADLVAAGDVDAALLLYAPDAAVHAGADDLRGRRIRGWLADSGLPGNIRSVETGGDGGLAVVRWLDPDGRPATWWARVAHGEIAEQWVAGARPPAGAGASATEGPPEPTVEIVARGRHTEGARDYASRKVRRVMDLVGEPVLHARVKLDVAPDPAVERPAIAQVTLDVNGRPVRAHVAARTVREAIDLLDQRLRDQIEHRAERQRALRRLTPGSRPGQWRHGAPRTERPRRFDRPRDEREVVRRKTFALDELTLDEAAFDLEALDADFYLFRELATGGDAVLHRLADGSYGLRRVDSAEAEGPAAVVDVSVDPRPAPELSLAEALEWLAVADDPFVLFRDRETGRAYVVYHRYDGHYGLIGSPDEPAPPAEPSTARRRLRDELDRLEAVRAAILADGLDRESETESVGDTASIDQHPADLGTETFERERELSLLEDVEAEIADVQRALARVASGTYGRCDACGATIPDERLVAVPGTRFCIEHQAANEIIGGLRARGTAGAAQSPGPEP
ncbi:MAG TPA: sigma 54 modulation/S30EA ribosomal C-terminal domain-containing protein [Acidimicrobiales bacterium]